MLGLPKLAELDQLHSSYLILETLAVLALAAGVLFYIGFIGWLLRVVGVLVRAMVRSGFLVWERLFAWARWPAFLAIVLGLLVLGCAEGEALPGLAIFCGAVPLFMGATACLAYIFIDLERYEVERGYKAVHNPMKGQDLAQYLVRYGGRVGVPLLVAAAVGVVGGFALLNLGLYRGVNKDWYRMTEEPAYIDFLVYALTSLYSIVDLFDVANNRHVLELAVVRPAAWPASTLLAAFRTFFTLVLLQQIFASVRKGKLLAEMITDFWSPHEPIHERARMALPQYGPIAIDPLLLSLRSVPTLTKEQRDQLPQILAMIGPSTIPVLVRHLADPHEHVRAVVVAALGQLHAREMVPQLVPLARDPSDLVRLAVVEALGILEGPDGKPLRKRRRLRLRGREKGGWWWSPTPPDPVAPDPAGLTVATLRTALADPATAVRTQAARALGQIGPPAGQVAPELMKALKDSDETVRCQAALALGRVGGEAATTVDALVGLLQDASAPIRAAAAQALGTLKKVAAPAVPALVPLLQDRDEAVRAAAAEAIAQAGPLNGQATHALVKGLGSSDTVVQVQTAEALGKIGTAAQDAAPALVKALDNGSDLVRAKAALALGKIGEGAAEVAVPSLVQALHDQDNWVTALAAEALGEMGEAADEAVPALVRSLGHGNALVRGNAAEALGKMGTAAARARAALERAARDEDGGVRGQAVRALGAIGRPTPTTDQAVLDGLQDADPLVRAAAVEAAGQWEDASAAVLKRMMPLLEDANDQVKVQVMQVLPRLTGAVPAVVDGLCRRLLEDDSTWVQLKAAQALGKLGPAAAAAGGPLLRAAQTGEEAVREQAMRAIVLIQPPGILQALAAGLRDASADIRKVASVGWIKADAIPAEAVALLVEALKDPESQVRANAARALGRLDALPAEAIPLLIECTTDPSDGLRLNAAAALQRAPAAPVADALHHLVEDPSPRVRLIAAGILLSTDPANAGASAVLAAALEDASPRVRKAALELLASLGTAAGPPIDVLRRRARLEDDPELRQALTRLLERQPQRVEMVAEVGPG